MKRIIITLVVVIAFSIIPTRLSIPAGFVAKAFGSEIVIVVPDNYPTIDGAINASTNGDTILIKEGTYSVADFILVNKSLTITGENVENTIVDGGGTAGVLFQVIASNVDIENLTLQNTNESSLGPGVRINNASNTILRNVRISNVYDGVQMQSASLSLISNCSVENSANGGIFLRSNSNNNTILDNVVYDNNIGIYFADTTCQFNSIYHNNLVNNTHQFLLFGGINFLDKGYPEGGNYWSDDMDVDLYNGRDQNLTGSDGLFDHPYMGADNYPLTSPLTVLNTVAENRSFVIKVSTNSTLLDYSFNGTDETFSVQVHYDQQPEAMRIVFPKALLSCSVLTDWIVSFNSDSGLSEELQRFVIDDSANTYIFVVYPPTSTSNTVVFVGTSAIPEHVDLSAAILVLFIVSVSLVVAVSRKDLRKSRH